MKCFSGQCFQSRPISPGTSKKYLTLLYSEGKKFQKGQDNFGQWLDSSSRGYSKPAFEWPEGVSCCKCTFKDLFQTP